MCSGVEGEGASEEDRNEGKIDRATTRLPGCMGTLGEMPLTLNVSTGQQSRSDKKLGGCLADIADLTPQEGMMADWAVELRREQDKLGKVKGDDCKQSGLRGKGRLR